MANCPIAGSTRMRWNDRHFFDAWKRCQARIDAKLVRNTKAEPSQANSIHLATEFLAPSLAVMPRQYVSFMTEI